MRFPSTSSKYVWLTIQAFVVLTVIGTCSSLKCFKCHGKESCEELECEDKGYSCTKISLVHAEGYESEKSCSLVDLIQKIGGVDGKCITKKGDNIFSGLLKASQPQDTLSLMKEMQSKNKELGIRGKDIHMEEDYEICACKTDYCNDATILRSTSVGFFAIILSYLF